MKIKTSLMVGTAVLIGVAGLIAKPYGGSQGGGTSILHFFVRKSMSPEGSSSNATGFVDAKQNTQGNANNQRLNIAVGNLVANTAYDLFALLNDDTEFTFATTFTTDSHGGASLGYTTAGSGKGNGQGKGKTPLPTVLNPLSNIRELAISNTSTQLVLVNTQVVLRADLTAPDKLQYLIKRKLATDGTEPNAEGALRIKATEKKVQFRLLAGNLNPATEYLFAINGSVVSSNASDADGNLSIVGLPGGAPDILDIHQVAIWNSVSNSVLSTTLP